MKKSILMCLICLGGHNSFALRSLVEQSSKAAIKGIMQAIKNEIYFDNALLRMNTYLGSYPRELKERIEKEFFYRNYGAMFRILDKGYLSDLGTVTDSVSYAVAINPQNSLLALFQRRGMESSIQLYTIDTYVASPYIQLQVPLQIPGDHPIGVLLYFNDTGNVLSLNVASEEISELRAWGTDGLPINPAPMIQRSFPPRHFAQVNAAGSKVIVGDGIQSRILVYAVDHLNDPHYMPQIFNVGPGTIEQVIFSYDDSFFVTNVLLGQTGGGAEHSPYVLQLWPVSNGVVQEPRELVRTNGHFIALNKEGTLLAVAGTPEPNQVTIWKLHNGKLGSSQIVTTSFHATTLFPGTPDETIYPAIGSVYFDEQNRFLGALTPEIEGRPEQRFMAWRLVDHSVSSRPLFQETIRGIVAVYAGDLLQVAEEPDAQGRSHLRLVMSPTLNFTLEQMLFLVSLERLWQSPLGDIKRYREHKEDFFAYIAHALDSLFNSETFATFSRPLQEMLIRIGDKIRQ